jgi:hypothetical protein
LRNFLIAVSLAALPSLTLTGWSLASSDTPSCFENLGQTGCPRNETFPLNHIRQLSCQNLWLVRNSIYNDRGYCFKTQAAKQEFDNSDCFVTDAGAIKFNEHEWNNITRISKVEKEKSC